MNKIFALVAVFACCPAVAQTPAPTKPPKMITQFDTRYADDKVIINNDFAGRGNISVPIGDYADTYADLEGVLRAKSPFMIKATPGNRGRCVAIVQVARDARIPKAVSLDTSLCQSTPSMDVNIR